MADTSYCRDCGLADSICKCQKKVKKGYELLIKPAIPPGDRHMLERTLESLGYSVFGGGTAVDYSLCDVSFEK